MVSHSLWTVSTILAIGCRRYYNHNLLLFPFHPRSDSTYIVPKWPEQLKDRLAQILLIRYDLARDVFEPIIKLSGNTLFQETYFQLLRTATYRSRLDC